jgi:hypothetical protein
VIIKIKKLPLLKLSYYSCSILHIGVEHVSGDMFKEIPKGDAIFMKVSRK